MLDQSDKSFPMSQLASKDWMRPPAFALYAWHFAPTAGCVTESGQSLRKMVNFESCSTDDVILMGCGLDDDDDDHVRSPWERVGGSSFMNC